MEALLIAIDHLLKDTLDALPLGGWQFHPVVGSTNDLALAWAEAGAPDWALVLADAQTSGRGREDRRWVTKPGAALAFSLVLRPNPEEQMHLSRFSALAALGLVQALSAWQLRAAVKWPNDVLLAGKKAAGVLVEAVWQGEALAALVVGMGVNVHPGAAPPKETLRFPAVDVATALGRPINRWALLGAILRSMISLRSILPGSDFMTLWNQHLAFRGEVVQLRLLDGQNCHANVVSVAPDGQLVLSVERGEMMRVSAGEIEIAYNKQ